MRQRALHSAADVTAPDGREDRRAPHRREHQVPESTNHDDPARAPPSEFGLPAAPTPDCGLVPSTTASTAVENGPLAALRSQRFESIPLAHGVASAPSERGVTLTATLRNESDQVWAYRVPRGPAPFAGGRSTVEDGELSVSPLDGDDLFSDGVLRPGEAVRATLSVSALGNAGDHWPPGEHTFLQPLTVWTAERAYSYNWRVTLKI